MIVGILDAAAILALLVLLVRCRRHLRQNPPSRLTILWAAPIALLLVVGAFVPKVFEPFLLLGLAGLATFVGPLIAAVGYLLLVVGAVRLPRSARDEQRFVTGAVVFYWLMLVVGLPTALVIPALQVTRFCLF